MIIPIQHIVSLNSKKNQVEVIKFDDQTEYVVKFFSPDHEKALVNEWLAYCLARYLQLPVPPSQIIEIPQDFYQTIPKLQHVPYIKHQFASTYLNNCVNGFGVEMIDEIINKDQLPGIIALDYWLCNQDRTRKNILLKEERKKKYHLWIIDHAESFGSTSWTLTDLSNLSSGILKSSTHEMMASFIMNERHLQEQVEIIQSIPTLLIEEILSFIPDDWLLNKEDRKKIIKTLQHRSNHLLQKMIEEYSAVMFPKISRLKKTIVNPPF